MTHVAYILLAHRDPDAVIAQARALTAAGDRVAIHYDRRAPGVEFARLQQAFDGAPSVCLVERRLRCGWGEWSLVAATLAAARTALDAFPDATHLYLMSGDCMPIKSARHIHDALAPGDRDFIESHDFLTSTWIKTGWKTERLVYRHFVNERRRKRLFYAMFEVQKRLRLTRPLPPGLRVCIGSQWWCLRRATVARILTFLEERPDLVRFFRTTWIPDETFFQTLVRHLVPAAEIANRPPTFLMFSDYGLPVTLYNDHFDFLLGQDAFFARKISPEATGLKARLTALFASDRVAFARGADGHRQYAFLASEGRKGRRIAPRFWEAGSSIGGGRDLLIVTCAKWHLGRRLAVRIGQVTGLVALGYLFNDAETAMPDLPPDHAAMLGRIGHRRMRMRMLFDIYAVDRMAICVDPSSLDILKDFSADRCRTRILEIDSPFGETQLDAQARAMGLVGALDADDARRREVRLTLGNQLRAHTDLMRAAAIGPLLTLSPGAEPEANVAVLCQALDLSEAEARAILAPGLFDD